MRSPHQAPRPLAFLVAGILLVTCLRVAGATELVATDWQLARYRTDAGLVDAAGGGSGTVLRFENGGVTGSAGCNRLLGTYTLDDDKLSIGPNLATTMMACPPPLMAQEQAVTQALAQVASYALADKALTLKDATGEPLLTFTQLAASPLAGSNWQLMRYNNGKGGVTTVLRGTEVALILGEDGQFSGKACNNYRGRYVAEDGAFRLDGPIAATKMRCSGPEGADAQEAAYFAALERAAAYAISGNELTLRDATGAILAVFRAAPPTA